MFKICCETGSVIGIGLAALNNFVTFVTPVVALAGAVAALIYYVQMTRIARRAEEKLNGKKKTSRRG